MSGSTYERVPQPPPLFDRLDPARDLEGEDTLILWWSMSDYLSRSGYSERQQLGALGFVMRHVGGLRLHILSNIMWFGERLAPEMEMLQYAITQFFKWSDSPETSRREAWLLIRHLSDDLGGIRLYIKRPDEYLRRVARDMLSAGCSTVEVAMITELGLRPTQRLAESGGE